MTPTAAGTNSDKDVAWSRADLGGNPHEVADKALRVRQMFAAIAPRYDLNNRLHSFGRDQSWRRRAVRLCAVESTDDVLDAACGTGDLTRAFSAARPRSVTGIDFTTEMIEIARAKSAAPAPNESTAPKFVQADAMNLPFADESFDIVSIAFGIRNVADPAKTLREFRRVLRPSSGRLMVLEFSRPRNPLIRWLTDVYTVRIMPFTATLIARDRSGAYRYLPRSVSTFPDSAQFSDLLVACGFQKPSVHSMTFGVCTAYLAGVSA